jgi:hypothetical protein
MSLIKAIQMLTEHPDVNRVHKLLYWVYTGQWAETMTPLQQYPIAQLLPDLVQRTPSFEVLERRLYKAAAVLTKPEKYRKIAVLVLRSCTLLYPPESIHPVLDAEPTQLAMADWVAEEVEEALPVTVVAQPDRFELRRLIMQQVPPLKVKILLFSVLRHPFSFELADWEELQSQTLDVWLAELLHRFPSVEIMEAQLFAQASELKALDQGTQIADAIIQAVRLQTL